MGDVHQLPPRGGRTLSVYFPARSVRVLERMMAQMDTDSPSKVLQLALDRLAVETEGE